MAVNFNDGDLNKIPTAYNNLFMITSVMFIFHKTIVFPKYKMYMYTMCCITNTNFERDFRTNYFFKNYILGHSYYITKHLYSHVNATLTFIVEVLLKS